MTKGEISNSLGHMDDPRNWQISVPVQPGNSGGPLFDEDGNVIGPSMQNKADPGATAPKMEDVVGKATHSIGLVLVY